MLHPQSGYIAVPRDALLAHPVPASNAPSPCYDTRFGSVGDTWEDRTFGRAASRPLPYAANLECWRCQVAGVEARARWWAKLIKG